MIKRILLTILQLILFGVLLFVGGFWPFVRMYALVSQNSLISWMYKVPVWKITFSPTHYVNINGYVYASVLLLLILAFQAAKRHFKPWMALTALAFLLAVLVSLQQKFGSVTVTN